MNPSELVIKPEQLSPGDREMMKSEKERTEGFLDEWKEFVGNIDNLGNEEIKEKIYQKLESEFDSLINELGISPNQNLKEQMDDEYNLEKKSSIQTEFIENIAKQLNDYPPSKWGFYPQKIKETKTINCSAAAMLMAHILNKSGIETYFGAPAYHAMNIVKLSDGKLLYVDARNSILKEKTDGTVSKNEIFTQELETTEILDKNDNFTLLKIPESGEHFFQLIPVFQKRDSIAMFLSNLESIAREYSYNEDIFGPLQSKLYLELQRLYQSEQWEKEQKTVMQKGRIMAKKLGNPPEAIINYLAASYEVLD